MGGEVAPEEPPVELESVLEVGLEGVDGLGAGVGVHVLLVHGVVYQVVQPDPCTYLALLGVKGKGKALTRVVPQNFPGHVGDLEAGGLDDEDERHLEQMAPLESHRTLVCVRTHW